MTRTQSLLAQFSKISDFTHISKKYKSGWVAINTENKIVAHAKTFAQISDKVKDRHDVMLIPASNNYGNLILKING